MVRATCAGVASHTTLWDATVDSRPFFIETMSRSARRDRCFSTNACTSMEVAAPRVDVPDHRDMSVDLEPAAARPAVTVHQCQGLFGGVDQFSASLGGKTRYVSPART